MRNFTILLVLFPLYAFRTCAQTESFKFASDVIWSLQTCKIADHRLKSSGSDDLVVMMKDLLVYSSGIKQASLFLDAHRESQDTMIRKSAEILSNVFSAIERNSQNLVAFIEESLNNPELAESRKGTWTRRLSEHAASNEELWRMFPVAIAGVTHALVDSKATRDGKLYRLRITRSELERLQNKLRDVFGTQITGGPKAGQFPLEASAALLYSFLSQGWTPSDSQ